LRRTEIRERILQGMKVSISAETFHSEHLPAITFKRQHQTGKNGSAIQKNGAGPAFPQFTTVLRAGMAKILAKNLEQRLVRREGNIDLFTVQRQPDL